MARDGIFKRCGCTEVVDGRRRQLGAKCPKLRRKGGAWSSTHGTWWFRIRVRGVDQPVRGGGYDSREDAERERDQVRERGRRGARVVRCPLVDAFLDEWLAGKGDLAASTRRSYAAHIRNHLVPPLGHLRLDELRVGHVAEAIAAVEGTDATRQRVRATLRSALNDAIREGLIVVNAAALVRLPAGKRPKALVWTDERVQRWEAAVERLAAVDADDPVREQLEAAAQPPSPVMVWTPAQLGAFLDAVAGDRLYALWHLVAHRGPRRGEVCGLEWQDVDLTAGTATISRQLVQLGWDVVESAPKSDAGRRTIALDAGTAAALRAHRRTQAADRLAWGEAWQDSGKVFVREDGSALHPATVTARFQDLAATAGLPPVRLHDLRHGAASLMLAAGVPMKVVQETLGHSSSAITADTYTSVYPTVAAEAAEAAAALVPRTMTGTTGHTSSTPPASAGSSGRETRRSESGPRGDRTHNPRTCEP